MNKQFWATAFTLSGGTIGAGILGLPYVFSESGWLAGLFWILVLGAIMLYTNLVFGEITLRTKGKHQISGYANIYLGKWGKRAGVFTLIFGIYAALLAYLVAEGESIASLLPGNVNPLYAGILFWIVLTFLLSKGLHGLKKVGTYGVSATILLIVGIFIIYLPDISAANLLNLEKGKLFFHPMGIVLFALLGFTSIPELKQEIKGQENKLKKAIILGTLIPILAYIVFTAAFVGALGKNISEVATLSSGFMVRLLGIFTMFTAYFILSFCLKKMFTVDLKVGNKVNFFFSSLVPLLLYIAVTKFGLLGFSSILGIGGIVSAGITGVLILLMAKKAKNKGTSSYSMPVNTLTIIIILTLFLAGSIIELFL